MAAELNYTAPPTVAKFMKSDAFFRLMQGPIGSGKSAGCVIEVLRRCIQMPKSPDGYRRSRWVIIRNTNTQLMDTTLKTWLQWVTPGTLGNWKQSDKVFYLDFNDVKAEILFRPLDSPEDVQRVLSLEVSGAWCNEARELPLEVIQALMGRIGRYPARKDVPEYWNGLIADTNPPEIDSIWYKIAEGIPVEEDNPNSVIHCDTFRQPSGLSDEAENVENLRPNYYDDLAQGKTRAWVDTYIHGEYAPSQKGKPVYADSFRADKHVSRTPLPIDGALPVIVGMDFGRTPSAVFMQLSLTGQLNILRETPAFGMGIDRFIKTKLRPMLKNCFPACSAVIIGDPAGVRQNDTDDNNCFKALRKAFQGEDVWVKPAPSQDPTTRINALERVFVDFPGGDPAVQIDPSCKTLIDGVRSKYYYESVRGADGKFKDKPAKTDQGHTVEACQYGALFTIGPKYDHRDFPATTGVFNPLEVKQPYRPAQSEGY